ncbi:MAG TPA: hypothetical protein VGO18_35225 [Steroidobacteraceae bacterium]|nr:hypothetical protein [Steroidobacteraceae bacterium]
MPAERDATTGAGGADERGATGVRASDVVAGDCGTGEGDVGTVGADDCKGGEGDAGDTNSDERGADACATWGVAVSG